jgi:hypothetical protein
MGFRDALSGAMRAFRGNRLGPREVEQLVSPERAGSAYPELSYLLSAAAAPPRADELAGHEAALAAFERAGLSTPVRTAPRRRMLTRSIAVKAFAGAALMLLGGTALAAETGNLPGQAQQHAHDLFSALGVPAPVGNASPAGVGPQTPRTSPAPTPKAGRTLSPSSPAVPGLCRAWNAMQKNPKGKPMAAEAFRDLVSVAGGENRIQDFCEPFLAPPPAASPTPSPPRPKATPSHPGNNGKGHGRPTSTPRPKG